MKKQIHNLIGGGVVIALSPLFINSVMADATSARLDAYKANRLIPQEIKLPTPETTESDSQEVVVFTSNALSWSAESAWTVKYADYMGLSKEDWESVGNFFADGSGHDNEWFARALEYLGKIQAGELTNPNLTAEDVASLNEGKGVIIGGRNSSGLRDTTLRAPFPKMTIDELLYASELTFEGGVPDWDWSKVEFYGVTIADTVNMSQLNTIINDAGYICDLTVNGINMDTEPNIPTSGSTSYVGGVSGLIFSEATAKDFQLAVLKSGGYCKYGADFSNDDLSDVQMAGTVAKANESLLIKAPKDDGYVKIENIVIKNADTTLNSNYKTCAKIDTVDCTQVSSLNKNNIPAALNYIATEAQFAKLSSDIIDNYDCVDYRMETPTITMKTASGNVVYKLIETPDVNGDHCNYTTQQSVSLRWEQQ